DALAGLEAVRLGKPYIYLCHCGIVDVAIPVMVGETYLGAVMFGQIRIANDDTDAKVEHLVNEISSFQTETDAARRDLMEMYNMLPEVEYKRIVEIAELIDSIVKYIVNRAVKSQTDARTYEWLLESVSGARGGVSGAHLDDVLPSAEPLALPEGITESSAVYPALAYIADHPSEAVAMKDMARLCHLSPGYFSRVFNRDTGETFVSYVNRRKTELAKVMLRETDKSVTQIAGELGYINISHFISLFKRFEGITPKVYRQYKYK
ncbi:MAG: PocR ligand-binding domain-containing protein, partial [Synergistes sp.]|nr:PocR ligand-binding domain-containing protein [Synergistes sp.]